MLTRYILDQLLKYIFYLFNFTKQHPYLFNYSRYGVIPILADILADAQKEKVSRIILAVFRVSFLQYFFKNI